MLVYSNLMKSRRSLGAAILTLIPAMTLLFGCRVEQRIDLDPDLSGHWEITGEAMPFASESLNDLAMVAGYQSATVFYDQAIAATSKDLEKRPDIRFHDIRRIGDAGWAASVEFTNIGSLLGSTEAGGITKLARSGGEQTLSLRFNRDNASHLETLVPLLTDPVFSLFNPADTAGIDEETYISQILGFTFGTKNIPAIRGSRVSLDLYLPGPVLEVTGGRKTGERSVHYESPFTRFMVPDDGIEWSVRWRVIP